MQLGIYPYNKSIDVFELGVGVRFKDKIQVEHPSYATGNISIQQKHRCLRVGGRGKVQRQNPGRASWLCNWIYPYNKCITTLQPRLDSNLSINHGFHIHQGFGRPWTTTVCNLTSFKLQYHYLWSLVDYGKILNCTQKINNKQNSCPNF